MLLPARHEEIAGLAEEVAETHFPAGRIAPLAIAKKKRVTVSFNDYGTAFDGLLEYRRGRFHIFCNTTRSRTAARTRFTLAHELGHFFIDEHRLALASGRAPSHGSVCDFRSANPVEREADVFASHLLMPSPRVLAALKHGLGSRDTVLALAELYGVSITSAVIRTLGLHTGLCAVIRWSNGRYDWKQLARSALVMGLGKTIESASELPAGSTTLHALRTTAPIGPSSAPAQATVANWFPFCPRSNAERPLLEEVVSLGRYGALTLLSFSDGRS